MYSGQPIDACQSFTIDDTTGTAPSFKATCLPVVEAVEGVEDYISMAMLQDLSTGDGH